MDREETENYKKAMEYLTSARSCGKSSYMFCNGKWYHIDQNFNPPKVEEVKE